MLGKRMNAFFNYHPVVNFVYFAAVIVFAMLFMHPVCLGISLVCGFAYALMLGGRKTLRFVLSFVLPAVVVMALINPLFNHAGVTILTYLPSGNPLTLESVLYGVAAAGMLASVLLWFSCYNHIMTDDKFIYLFGKAIPSLSLVFSMVLRFVPRFTAQLKVISAAWRGIGRGTSSGSVMHRIRNGLKLLSVMVSWSLEDAVETADSMRGRGYGLPGRTAFSLYIFTKRDRIALVAMLFLIGYMIVSCFWGSFSFQYFPTMVFAVDMRLVSAFFAYAILCIIPILIELWEELTWTS